MKCIPEEVLGDMEEEEPVILHLYLVEPVEEAFPEKLHDVEPLQKPKSGPSKFYNGPHPP